jgi:pimeloyl-ACP methyl ester carboxylesterase
MAASDGAFNHMRYADGYWWSNDGLRLHYRDYHGPGEHPPILCLPGLTRNARDFAALAERLSPHWRVIVLDFRGRGESAYAKDAMTYAPLTYVQDVERLLTELDVSRCILFGTSLGGIVSMLLAATGPGRIAGVLLNDIGPVIEPDGLARIRSYVGRAGSWPTWVHAARALGESNAAIYPSYKLEDWLAMAKRLYRLTAQGRVVPDYDKAIAEPFRMPGGEGGIDLWPALAALTHVPLLIVRGETSDILSAATAAEMQTRLPGAALVTVPRVGHAPTLDEPDAVAGINALLARIAA